ncbi:MAG: hypothetical protein RBG13Loki_0367 [Promethearchaeota archaeon CR_4]|nr:MAG: hypothetical protein RBG13Loki_0367 [Candidatus Lokiarchaeota archaeon CR_4]
MRFLRLPYCSVSLLFPISIIKWMSVLSELKLEVIKVVSVVRITYGNSVLAYLVTRGATFVLVSSDSLPDSCEEPFFGVEGHRLSKNYYHTWEWSTSFPISKL